MKSKIKYSIEIHENFVLVFLNNELLFKQFVINGDKVLTLFYVFSILKKIGFLNKK